MLPAYTVYWWLVQVNEGYPMAAPTSTVLQATKRATRYWPLYTQVLTAVRAAYASQSDSTATGVSKSTAKDPLDDINSLPGDCGLWPSGILCGKASRCHCALSLMSHTAASTSADWLLVSYAASDDLDWHVFLLKPVASAHADRMTQKARS